MTGFPFASCTTPCSAACFGVDWPGKRCCATDCCGEMGLVLEATAVPAHSKLRSSKRHADFEMNTRDASRIRSSPGYPASFRQKQLESSGDHSLFRSWQISFRGSARKTGSRFLHYSITIEQ